MTIDRRALPGMLVAAILTVVVAACGSTVPTAAPSAAQSAPSSRAPNNTSAPIITPAPASQAAGTVPGGIWGAGAGRLSDGRVLVYGGARDMNSPSSKPYATGAVFDPTSGKWTATALGPSGRFQPSIFMGSGGTGLVMGADSSSSTAQGQIVPLIYDPKTDTWRSGKSYSQGGFFTPTASFAQLQDGRILTVTSRGAAIYDPKADAWTKIATAPNPLDYMALVTLTDGRVLAAGGEDAGNKPSTAARIYDPVANSWQAAALMPAAWRIPTVVALPNGGALALGGPGFGFGVSGAARYDAKSDSWKAEPALAVARQEPAITTLADGRVLVAGGSVSTLNCATVTGGEVFDPAKDSWSAVAGLAVSRAAALPVLLTDGKVLLVLGAASSSQAVSRNTCELNRLLTDSELLDPAKLAPIKLPNVAGPATNATGFGSFTASKIVASDEASTVTLADGSALVIGGQAQLPASQGGYVQASSNVWHIALDGTITAAAPMASARTSPYATRLTDGTVLVIGPDAGVFVAGKARGPNAERYDPVADKWHAVADPGQHVGAALAALPGARAILIGGSVPKSDGPYVIDGSTQIFDPKAETWSQGPALPAGALDPAVVGLASGQVLVAGGIGFNGPVSSSFIFDPTSNAWTPARALPAPRSRAQALVLPDGRVMLVGGYGIDGPLPDAAILDKGGTAWTTTATYGTAREGAGLTLMADGRVLLAGGVAMDGTGAVLGTCVVYDPKAAAGAGSWSLGPSLTTPRGFAATVLVGAGVQLLGGYGVGGPNRLLDSRETLGPAAP